MISSECKKSRWSLGRIVHFWSIVGEHSLTQCAYLRKKGKSLSGDNQETEMNLSKSKEKSWKKKGGVKHWGEHSL